METMKIYGENDIEEWNKKMNEGSCESVTEGLFNYFLGVLPPVCYAKTVTSRQGEKIDVSFGFAEGCEPITYFFEKCGYFFSVRQGVAVD